MKEKKRVKDNWRLFCFLENLENEKEDREEFEKQIQKQKKTMEDQIVRLKTDLEKEKRVSKRLYGFYQHLDSDRATQSRHVLWAIINRILHWTRLKIDVKYTNIDSVDFWKLISQSNSPFLSFQIFFSYRSTKPMLPS